MRKDLADISITEAIAICPWCGKLAMPGTWRNATFFCVRCRKAWILGVGWHAKSRGRNPFLEEIPFDSLLLWLDEPTDRNSDTPAG